MRSNGQRRHPPVSPKKALAEAIRQLGAAATHNDLVRFTKERFGLDLQYVLFIPKSVTRITVPSGCAGPGQARKRAG